MEQYHLIIVALNNDVAILIYLECIKSYVTYLKYLKFIHR